MSRVPASRRKLQAKHKGRLRKPTDGSVLDKLTLKGKSYFDLSPEERKVANALARRTPKSKLILETFTFAVNPTALQSGLKHYIAFIDAVRNDYYNTVHEYLAANASQFNSVCVTGAADFVVELQTTQQFHDAFVSKVGSDLESAADVNSFLVEKYYILWGEHLGTCPMANLDQVEMSQVEALHGGYNRLLKKWGPTRVEQALNDLESKNVILSYYAIKDFLSSGRLRQYIGLCGTPESVVEALRDDGHLSQAILTLCKVRRVTDIGNPFFQDISHIAVAEFSGLEAYHAWKQGLYQLAVRKRSYTNVFTFDVEERISEKPLGIGNYLAYDDLLRKHAGKTEEKKLRLAYAVHFLSGQEDKQHELCIPVRGLVQHGAICGASGSGKTTTALSLCVEAQRHLRAVYVLDSTGGIQEKARIAQLSGEDFTELPVEGIISSGKFVFDQTLKRVAGCFAAAERLRLVTSILLDAIETMADAGEEEKYRIVNFLVLFEEAHYIFSDTRLADKLFHTIHVAGRKGVSIWLSNQRLAQFPKKDSSILDDLKNRIFHRMDSEEARAVEALLAVAGKGAADVYPLVEEVSKLKVGQAFITPVFWSSPTEFATIPPAKGQIRAL